MFFPDDVTEKYAVCDFPVQAASINFSAMIPAKPLTGVPMTYGVENRSSNTFAAGNPTDEITRFTSASPAFCISSMVLPIAKVLMISKCLLKNSFMESKVEFTEKSSGVAPKMFIFILELLCFDSVFSICFCSDCFNFC